MVYLQAVRATTAKERTPADSSKQKAASPATKKHQTNLDNMQPQVTSSKV